MSRGMKHIPFNANFFETIHQSRISVPIIDHGPETVEILGNVRTGVLTCEKFIANNKRFRWMEIIDDNQNDK